MEKKPVVIKEERDVIVKVERVGINFVAEHSAYVRRYIDNSKGTHYGSTGVSLHKVIEWKVECKQDDGIAGKVVTITAKNSKGEHVDVNLFLKEDDK